MMNVSEADYMPSEIFTLADSNVQASMATVEDSADIFDEDGENVNVIPVVGPRKFKYVSFGPDDKLPLKLLS